MGICSKSEFFTDDTFKDNHSQDPWSKKLVPRPFEKKNMVGKVSPDKIYKIYNLFF